MCHTVVFSTNKTDCHNIAEILLKLALNTINQTIQKKKSKVSEIDHTNDY
jgi:hypothetical protein